MNNPIFVSILRRENGREVIRDFSFAPVAECGGCLRRGRNALTPVEPLNDGASVTPTGAALCKACGLSLPLLDAETRATWPALTAREVESLWELVQQGAGYSGAGAGPRRSDFYQIGG